MMIKKNQSDRENVKFFNICVDNFFTNPDKIREYGLSLDYKPDTDGRWPGVRSPYLHNIDKELNQLILSKIFRAHYPGNKNNINWETSMVCFHKTKSWGDKAPNEGWVHVDDDQVLAGLIYLTPDCNLEGGTNVYQLKDEWKKEHDESIMQRQKRLLYTNSPYFNKDKYIEELRSYNDRFNIVTKFNNVYNRMVMWSGSEYHGANSFKGFDNEERLTLLFFINGIKVDAPVPIDVVREIDESIESKIATLK